MEEFQLPDQALIRLADMVNKECEHAEHARNVAVVRNTRAFFVGVIEDSLQFRTEEWWERYKIDARDLNDLLKAIDLASGSVNTLLENAEPTAFNNVNYLLVVNITNESCKRWCEIFPFC